MLWRDWFNGWGRRTLDLLMPWGKSPKSSKALNVVVSSKLNRKITTTKHHDEIFCKIDRFEMIKNDDYLTCYFQIAVKIDIIFCNLPQNSFPLRKYLHNQAPWYQLDAASMWNLDFLERNYHFFPKLSKYEYPLILVGITC